jgi:hypothetical protein
MEQEDVPGVGNPLEREAQITQVGRWNENAMTSATFLMPSYGSIAGFPKEGNASRSMATPAQEAPKCKGRQPGSKNKKTLQREVAIASAMG